MRMASQGKGEGDQHSTDDNQSTSPTYTGWPGMIQQQYRKIKENAETYPYVWGSYIVVYGGFGLWFTYRWRKLRRTEDRVRVLQDRLRKLVEAEDSASSAVAEKVPPTADKPGIPN
ncbi:hypothetical protein M9H77_14101 [Catharanthus roseus]|uniref:Uncharacterized protein n=1 Tax=Catharanthus roseus TaxID=4058 RepID=A0ACC0BMC8_CATRO|nr:hypothetical protein M9H77_14101 [Catharanthus roseus]